MQGQKLIAEAKAPSWRFIPGFNEDSGKMSCVWRWVGFGWPHDSRRLSYRRGSQSADRAGSRRFGRRSRDKARQRPGAVGSGDELSTSGRGSLVRRRHDPRLVRAVRTKRRRRPEPLRRGRQFEQDDAPTMRSFEGLGWGDPPALDASHRCLDRQGIWPCLRKPLGADRAAASPGARISQAGSHLAQARPQNAEGVYRELRRPVEFQGRRRGRDIRGRGASHPRGAARGLLGPEGTEARDRTDERTRAHQHPRRDRPRNRPDPHDRSRNDRRDIDDPAAGIAGIALSADGLHPLDNAPYHPAKLVKEWLARPSCRIKLHFLPTYCPHLNPIERLWGVMHKNITHNKCYGTCGEFAETTLEFLRDEVPRRWAEFCDSVTDNFRIISPKDFRLLG